MIVWIFIYTVIIASIFDVLVENYFNYDSINVYLLVLCPHQLRNGRISSSYGQTFSLKALGVPFGPETVGFGLLIVVLELLTISILISVYLMLLACTKVHWLIFSAD